MRVIYILGLEHSGTTLTDQLLSGCAGVVGLGEVAGYFSPQHMRNRKDIVYDDSWRKYKALKLIYSMHASAKKMNRDFHSSFDLSC